MASGKIAYALYDYTGSDQNELSFRVGQQIKILTAADADG